MSQVPAAHVEVQGGPRIELVSVMGMTWDLNLPFELGRFPCGNCDVRGVNRIGRDREMSFYSNQIGPLVVEFLEVKVGVSSTCDELMLFIFFVVFMDFKCDTY